MGDHLGSIVFLTFVLFLIYLANSGKLNTVMTIMKNPASVDASPNSGNLSGTIGEGSGGGSNLDNITPLPPADGYTGGGTTTPPQE